MSPWLSPEEWSILEAFLDLKVQDRQRSNGAFWENTFANDHGLSDTFVRHAWVGDRVLNLALADHIEASRPPSFYWGGTFPQLQAQSGWVASQVVSGWPAEIRGLLRFGNKWTNESVSSSIWATYGEAIIGLIFREHDYAAARDFAWKYWPTPA